MMKTMMKKSKKGVTLVESVFAVVILGILSIGIISLLTSGGVKIQEISQESGAYSQAVQKMDLVISAISNGSNNYIIKDESDDSCTLATDKLLETLNLSSGETLGCSAELYDATKDPTVSNLRGWYLTLTYQGVTVKGFASNSEGVFDKG